MKKMIVSHHHDLEVIYIGVYNKSMSKIEYSDLIHVDNIKLTVYDKSDIENLYVDFDEQIFIYLSVEESRMFDTMTSTMSELNNNEK